MKLQCRVRLAGYVRINARVHVPASLALPWSASFWGVMKPRAQVALQPMPAGR